MAFSSLSGAGTAAARQALAVDGRSLNALKLQAGQGDAQATRDATREAARQLESLFMRELIKSMREATAKSGLLDGAEGNLANDLFDQQLSVQMSGRPGGLADAIQRQLSRQLGGDGQTTIDAGSTLSLDATLRKAAPADNPRASAPKGRENFVQHHRAAAERVAQDSGIPASFMLGQAGHETGWGRSEIRNKDGSNAFNLFGIKAGKGWTGKVAEVTTTEYVNGQPRKVTARFRAYGSYEESFRDYARLINDNPRYEKARAKTHSAAAYAAELQKAGYATDPQYATKLARAIQSTQSVARNPVVAQAPGTQA
ncbi:flagellar assembly peptidoglycan hydrolase FlgJ [Alicycliphilus denitrificans]|uniref:Peptidoglycan hydrolase FlgJ n=2 Tax=Alicycliphilus denitrificans TaxID=179636 RepID=F4G6T5_ALIDK|nr:flagellar assembly peptidoglycan hydrolase FlgJ [Alicycliphilus denitrificans]GAO21369.1 flagellar rod assembly protein/muramidase FlgJ [Alicycliphilus sp. B1]ADV01594.1 flagellar rod assembly protein/muramidase FlgJ [Alicycliphilus denitrificans BC]AEB86547.1 flagellar rod assembly protein/muramidase FlgJ [Alicycliphilus denitrificans K601]QKD45649.1 flagellar assembly peptidoglycan hydrolase FlgJ [Alicycliphilus denitrificans]GAO25161.1 flagellar rod assembly protein FlgJ [Alicycliphilus 